MDQSKPVLRSHKRFGILGMIFVCVIINYVDRSCISVAAPALMEELKIDPVTMGMVYSAFAWTYAALQIPGGVVVDLIRPRVLYTILLAFWSLATFFQGLAQNVFALIGCRMGIGLFQAPSYPCHNRMVTSWFPVNERAFAIGFYTSGQFLGLAIATPLLMILQEHVGWRWMLMSVGGIGLIWAAVWYALYRDPLDHKRVTDSELDHIAQGGGLVGGDRPSATQTNFRWNDLKLSFCYRKLWGVYLGQFCMGGIFLFFLTWFPTYLVKYRGFDYKKSALLAAIPFLAAFVGVLLSGACSDFLKRRGFSSSVARKLPVIVGLLLSASIVGANYTEDTFWMMFFLSLAFFGNGLASIAWVFVSEIAPKNLLGLVGGVFNFVGNLAAVIVPVVIGFLISGEEGDFRPALVFVAVLALIGVFNYTVVVGKVERVVLPDTEQ
jgi:MFS transporter, ACS family, D-galactonate transporter